MLRSLFFVLLVACNAEHSLTSSQIGGTDQTSDQSADRRVDQQQSISQSSGASLSYQQVAGDCSNRDLGTFVAENYLRYTVNPTTDKSTTLVGGNKLRHTVTMGLIAGREIFIQPSRPRYQERYLVSDGVINGNNTEFTLNNDPLGSHSGQGCHITIWGYRRDSYRTQYCIDNGISTDGRKVIIPTNKLNNLDRIIINYANKIREPFKNEFTLTGQRINEDSLRVNNRTKYFDFNNNGENKLILTGGPGAASWHHTHNYIFEGTKMVITYNVNKLSYELVGDANTFNLDRTRCFADNTEINCTVSGNKVHFQASDFVNNQEVVVNLQLRTSRKVPLGDNYVPDSAVLTFDGNTCEDDQDELTIDDNNNILIDTAEAKSACSMLTNFDDNNESITVTYKTYTPNQDDLVIESGFFARHQHNAACYELWVNDTESASDSYTVKAVYSAEPTEQLPFDASVVFKVFLLHKETSE